MIQFNLSLSQGQQALALLKTKQEQVSSETQHDALSQEQVRNCTVTEDGGGIVCMHARLVACLMQSD